MSKYKLFSMLILIIATAGISACNRDSEEQTNTARAISGGDGALVTEVVDSETTLPVLQSYFEALRAGNYYEAARIYGGDYTQLIEINPEADPGDAEALFEAACTVNGFNCSLKIGEVIMSEKVSNTAVQFTLNLVKPDGSSFELSNCCSGDNSAAPAQGEFTYTIELQDGQFRVLELPVYMP